VRSASGGQTTCAAINGGKHEANANYLSNIGSRTVVGKPATADTPTAGYVGWTYSSVSGCPYIEWKLARHSDGSVTGIVYYSDMSGVSTANGTVGGGHFQLALTSSMGNGPVGTVTGTSYFLAQNTR
jgi:hypothetical protein